MLYCVFMYEFFIAVGLCWSCNSVPCSALKTQPVGVDRRWSSQQTQSTRQFWNAHTTSGIQTLLRIPLDAYALWEEHLPTQCDMWHDNCFRSFQSFYWILWVKVKSLSYSECLVSNCLCTKKKITNAPLPYWCLRTWINIIIYAEEAFHFVLCKCTCRQK